ncbi:MAG: recombination protein O N-terminal domain-containing protein [Candidatus Gracilibacteria bacterium]|nr:recombination protein O N-terminal domain-containing protein [Candidatus Gracilibacteria bacterium]
MGNEKTMALLLRRTVLANDDAVLEFFTQKWGKISLFVKKFSRSKKRADLDFFRLLELEIFQGRQSRSLRDVSTKRIFPAFLKSYAASEMGFGWLERFSQKFEEAPPPAEVFPVLEQIFGALDPAQLPLFDALFCLRLLDWRGQCPQLDRVRGNCFFSPETQKVSADDFTGAELLSNRDRQRFEFLRRTPVADILKKQKTLAAEDFSQVQALVHRIEFFCE